MKKEKMSRLYLCPKQLKVCVPPHRRGRGCRVRGFLEGFCSLRKHEMMRRQEAVWRQFHENLHCAATQNSAAATL